MACNNPETPADGATPAAAAPPTSPAPATAPASRPSLDALITPCCNSSCRLPGCAATLNFCSDCYAERFRTHKIADVNGGAHRSDLLVDQSVAALGRSGDAGNVTPRYKSPTELNSQNTSSPPSEAPVSAGFEDLRVSAKAKGLSAGGQKIAVQASVHNPFDKHSGVRMPSPLSLSPLLQAETPPPEQKTKNRCLACRKRLGLRGFKCRCGDVFCALHRYSDKHNCSFDYKAAGRLAIAKENPLVISSKIIKI